MEWIKAKPTLLTMPINKKREYYKCGNNFKTISDIADWSTYAKTDEPKLDVPSATVEESSEKDAMNEDMKTDEAKQDVPSATVEESSEKDALNEGMKTDEAKQDVPSAKVEESSEKDALNADMQTDKAKLDVPSATVEESSEKNVLNEDMQTDDAKLDVSSVEKEPNADETNAKLDTSSETDGHFPKNDVFNKKISLFTGDITCLEIDAIVNAANDALVCGGGVDAAIHAAAGRELLEDECWSLDGCDTGDAKITGGYKLPAKYVIHAVGPRGEDPNLLSSCYKKSMDLLKQHKLETIAFPCISTGIYGYPNKNAAAVALETIRKWLDEDEYSSNVKRVIFCLFLDIDIKLYHKLMPKYFPL